MLSKYKSLTSEDWAFIVIFDLIVLYVGYRLGKNAAEKENT